MLARDFALLSIVAQLILSTIAVISGCSKTPTTQSLVPETQFADTVAAKTERPDAEVSVDDSERDDVADFAESHESVLNADAIEVADPGAPSRPTVTRREINAVAQGPGSMADVYDLLFDYDMTLVSDADYKYLADLLDQTEIVDAADRAQRHLQNAYESAARGGEEFSVSLDPSLGMSSRFARLSALKTIVDDARSKP